jgi:hypothetical protein
MSDTPRKRPGRTDEGTSKSIGSAEQKSRAKAETARKRTADQNEVAVGDAPDGVPLNANGRPLAKITLTASELIPTGQFANVSVGPAQITTYIDPDRVLERDDDGNVQPYFSEQEAETYAAALNQLAEIIEIDVIAVQRNLVLESIQEQVTNGGGK